MNEFGIKGFDFSLTNSGAQMGYVFKNLDKWYIRKILETDLHFMFSRPKMQPISSNNDTAVYANRIKPNLRYIYYFNEEKKMSNTEMWKGDRKIATMRQYSNKLSEKVLSMQHTDGVLSYEFCEINKTQ